MPQHSVLAACCLFQDAIMARLPSLVDPKIIKASGRPFRTSEKEALDKIANDILRLARIKEKQSTSGQGRPCCVYRHFDDSGVLLYIGMSVDFLKRTSDHVRKSGWSKRVATVTITWYDTPQEASIAEAEAIKTEKPLFNKMFSSASALP
jgi:predicted GIY-YIG superfamily endonuclease